MFQINDILNKENSEIIKLSELILFICVITSKEDYYIEIIRHLKDAKFVNSFFSRIAKYILLESKDDENNKSFSELSKSYIGLYSSNNTLEKQQSELETYKNIKILLDHER